LPARLEGQESACSAVGLGVIRVIPLCAGLLLSMIMLIVWRMWSSEALDGSKTLMFRNAGYRRFRNSALPPLFSSCTGWRYIEALLYRVCWWSCSAASSEALDWLQKSPVARHSLGSAAEAPSVQHSCTLHSDMTPMNREKRLTGKWPLAPYLATCT
jgi:hypothetical protein